MFCKECGKEVLETAVVCVGCGSSLGKSVKTGDFAKWSGGKLFAIAFATILMPIVGIIAGIMGLCTVENRTAGACVLIEAVVLTSIYMNVL